MKPGNLIFAYFLTLLAAPAFGQSVPAPLSRSEILGRLALGRPPSSIAQLIKTQGIAFTVSSRFVSDVERAGGRGILLERLLKKQSRNVVPLSKKSRKALGRLS
jgi:hypothetical protein